jgi:hypothetical protein
MYGFYVNIYISETGFKYKLLKINTSRINVVLFYTSAVFHLFKICSINRILSKELTSNFNCTWHNKDFRWWYVGIDIGFWNFSETTYTLDVKGATVTFECFNIVGRFVIVR